MKLIVTGGRDFNGSAHFDFMWDKLRERYHFNDFDHQPSVLIHGDCDGADKMAANIAAQHNIIDVAFPATGEMWQLLDKQAGNIRNRQMLIGNRSAIVAAFPGPKSRGTWNCMKDACRLGMRVDLFQLGHPDQLNWKP